MLNKISNNEIIKGFIGDYSKIKDEFKEMLRNDGFRWQNVWKRQNAFGMEGVWLNPISKLSLRIRWGVVNPSAIIYAEVEYLKNIRKFLDSHDIVVGISSANQDYDILNIGIELKNELKNKIEEKGGFKNVRKKRERPVAV